MTDTKGPAGKHDEADLAPVAQQLRADDPGDPRYQPGRFARLVSAGLLDDAGARRRNPSRMRSPLLGGVGVGSIALVLTLVIGVIAFRVSDRNPAAASPSPAATDLLAQVRDAGVLRVAIRPDFPQATTDKLAGFDVDVASALATRLGVRLEIEIVDASAMASPTSSSGWDVAMPSTSLIAAGRTFTPSDSYYAFPAFLVVAEGSPVAVPGDLGGARVCVVAGSPGEAWVGGRYEGAAVEPSPPDSTVRIEADDQACLDAMSAGEVDAIVTAALTASDIGVRASIRTLGQPVLVDSRSIVARSDGPDPSTLLSAIDAALDQLRGDGTLSSLSRNRFGGQDLSTP